MADISEATAVETPAQKQARIRKEKREAKIKNGGSARLNKIIGLGGGLPRDEAPAPASATNASSVGDPEEVDISNHYYEPQARAPLPRAQSNGPSQQQINDDQLRQMMLGMDSNSPFGGMPGQKSFAGFPGMDPSAGGDGANDPMMKMLQQMMSGGPPGEANGNMPSFPGMPGMNMQGQAQAAAADPYAYIWRIIHAIFALSLGLYIALTTSFTGSKFERESSGIAHNGLGTSTNINSAQFFYIFASAEVVLLTSRFFLEKGRALHDGWIGTIMSFLPEPWKGYVGLVLRYARIWGTVSGDAMVCVFVLGACAWFRGGM